MTDAEAAMAQISFHLENCNKIYQIYRDNGNKFFIADALYGENQKVVSCIDHHISRIDPAMRAVLSDLSVHIAAWSAQFRAERAVRDPGPEDPFVFDTLVQYPAEARALLGPA